MKAKNKLDDAVKRRVRAGRLLLAGKSPPEVARAVGAPRQTVYRWRDVLEAGGIDALRDMSKGGRPSRLGAASCRGCTWHCSKARRRTASRRRCGHSSGSGLDRTRIRRAVQRGARLALARAVGVLQPEAGSARLGARRGGDRALAQADVAGSKKNARREGRLIVFIDESGVSERPTRVRTWAVKGETPVVQFHFNWHQLSLIAGMHFRGLCFRLHEGTIAKEQVVEFLKALLAHFRRPLLILWDSLQAHRSHLVRDYVAADCRTHQAPFPARLRARPQSSRISLDLAQAPRAGQLLSRHLRRVAAYRARQAQIGPAP